MVVVGRKSIFINKQTCEDLFSGFYDVLYGCIVNSNFPFKETDDGKINVTPLNMKIFPILVDKKDFIDMSTKGGRWKDIYTYAIK